MKVVFKGDKICHPWNEMHLLCVIIKIKMPSSVCEIEDFVETSLCKLRVILLSRVLLGVWPHY